MSMHWTNMAPNNMNKAGANRRHLGIIAVLFYLLSVPVSIAAQSAASQAAAAKVVPSIDGGVGPVPEPPIGLAVCAQEIAGNDAKLANAQRQ